MVRIPTRSSFAVVAGLGIALTGACSKDKDADKKTSDNKTAEKQDDKQDKQDKDKKAGDTATGDKAMTTPGAKPADQQAPAQPASMVMPANPNADDLHLLPKDADVVVGVNWTQLTASALWQKFVAPQFMSDPKFQDGVGKIKTICGFDPMSSITSISAGLRLGDTPDGAIVIHGFDKTKSMGCFDKEGKAEAEKDGTKVTIEDNVVLMQKDKFGVGFTFVNDSTVLVVINATSIKGIKDVAAGDTSLAKSDKFLEFYNKVNTSDSVWGLANGSSKALADKLSRNPAGVKVKAIYGSIKITDGVAADLHVRLASPEEANGAASMGKAASGQLSGFVDKLDVVAEGADVHTTVAIGSAKLMQLAQLAAGAGGHHTGSKAGGGGGMFGPH
jgi:hypothetical protein